MPAPRVLAVPALALIAGAYFALGRGIGIEWADTGMLLYPSWRVARGELPYRDFYQLFGPSLFYVNALIMRLFGEDVGVLRSWVLVIKVLIAVLVYLNTRRLVSWPFALAVFALLVIVWGTPFWVFNAPYANHYAVAFQLAALWLLGAPNGRPAARCLAAGLCLGMAATFKQTSGLFGAAGVALALILAPPPWLAPGFPARFPAGVRRGLRLTVPAAAVALFAAYLAPRNTIANVVILATPLAVVLIACLQRERRRPPDPAPLTGIFWLAVGMAMPLLAYAAYFGWRGALGALIFNTMRGLPERIAWFNPLPLPPLRHLAAAAAVCAALLAAHRRATGTARWALVAVALALAAGAFVDLLRQPLSDAAWYGEVYAALFLLVVASVWMANLAMFRASERQPAQVLLTVAGAVGLLSLYPVGDVWHLFMGLPLLLPLLAQQGERACAAAAPEAGRSDRIRAPAVGPRRRAVVAAAAALVALMCAPFVHALIQSRQAVQPTDLPRASGVFDTTPRGRAAASVATQARAQPPERRVFVIGYDGLLAFASARESSAGGDDFLLYMVAMNALRGKALQELVPDAMLRDRLALERPLLIEVAGPTARRFRAAFPLTAAFVDVNAHRVRSIGPYSVLEWNA